MTSNVELESCLAACAKKNNEIIQELHGLIVYAERFHQKNNELKTVGTLTGVAGGITTAACIIAAPFTGGLSVLGLLGGGALSLSGGAVNIAAGFDDKKTSKKIIDSIKNLLASRETLVSALKEQIDVFNRLVESLVSNGVSPEIAKCTILQGIANGSFDLKNKNSYSLMLKTALCASRILQFDAPLITQSAALANTSLRNLSYMFGLSASATSTIFKTFSTGLVFLSIVFIAVDIKSLVNSWSTDHPTVAVINDVIKQLKDEVTSYEEFLSVIDSCKERVYLSTIDDILIIGSISEFNDLAISLFNNDIPRCKEILEQLDMNWTFASEFTSTELAAFILQYHIVIGFDKEKLKCIIEKTEKKSSKATETKVESLLSEIQHLLSNAKHSNDDGRREEHIINLEVSSVYKDVIEAYVQHRYGVTFDKLSKIPQESQIYQDYHCSLPDHVKHNIENVMIASIPNDVIYINANALIYGTLKHILVQSAQLHMSELYNDTRFEGTTHTSKIKSAVAFMNQLNIFIDDIAKKYWLQRDDDKQTFEDSRLSVQGMFSNLNHKLPEWVEELRRYMS